MKHIFRTAVLASAAMGLTSIAHAQTSPTTPGSQGYGQPGTMERSPQSGSNSQSGSMGSGGTMSEASVKSLLQTRGYSEVDDIERDGQKFKADAKKNGEEVTLEIDSQGNIRLDEDSAEKLIQKEGFSDVSDIERKGNQYHASAKKDGDDVKVEVNAASGEVRERKD
jgi:uncharacterized membrane protein YkoI